MINKLAMKTLVFLIFLITAVSLQAQTWISLDGISRPAENLDLQLTEGPDGLTLDFNIPGMLETRVSMNGENYQLLSIPGASFMMESGKPQLPLITKLIEIPAGARITPEIQIIQADTRTGFNIVPFQLTYDIPEPEPFQKDEALYAADEFFPGTDISVGEEMKLRGHSLVAITINPVRFNPVTNTVKTLTQFKVLLKYTQTDVSVSANKFATEFESLVTGMVLNPATTEISEGAPHDAEAGAEYVIITHDDFYDPSNPAASPLQSLANHKMAKGLTVKIVRLSEIGATPTANDIRAYIQQAYNNWIQAPIYLLLVGDGAQIPVSRASPRATDLYYGAVDGSDFIPDIFVGRFAAANMNEVTTMVNKTINYENDNAAASWKRRVLLAAYFQDDEPDGIGNRGYLETAEEARSFLDSMGYDSRAVYTDSRTVSPTHTTVPTTYNNGNPIPPSLQFSSQAQATQNIVDIINEGVVIAAHRDHGHYDQWWQPRLLASHVPSLGNIDKLPLIFGINCYSGRFHDRDGLGEVMVESQTGGAIGYIGATEPSPTFQNHILYAGLFDCIFPAYKPFTHGTAGSKKMAVILAYGKMHLFSSSGSGSLSVFEMYNLIGDPELEIKLEVSEMLGDVNGDLSVTIVDALMIAQHYVGLNPQPFNEDVADVNCDGDISIIDALMVAQYYVGLITEFPCEEGTYQGMDLGSPVIPGSFTANGDRLVLTGAGKDIWGDADEGYMVAGEKSGNFSLTARVHSLDPTHEWAKAGIMVRSSSMAQSKNVFMAVTADNGVTFQRRLEDGQSTISTKAAGYQAPIWLRLSRENDLITGEYSTDGNTWQILNSITLPLGDTVVVGPAVTSHDVDKAATAEFEMTGF